MPKNKKGEEVSWKKYFQHKIPLVRRSTYEKKLAERSIKENDNLKAEVSQLKGNIEQKDKTKTLTDEPVEILIDESEEIAPAENGSYSNFPFSPQTKQKIEELKRLNKEHTTIIGTRTINRPAKIEIEKIRQEAREELKKEYEKQVAELEAQLNTQSATSQQQERQEGSSTYLINRDRQKSFPSFTEEKNNHPRRGDSGYEEFTEPLANDFLSLNNEERVRIVSELKVEKARNSQLTGKIINLEEELKKVETEKDMFLEAGAQNIDLVLKIENLETYLKEQEEKKEITELKVEKTEEQLKIEREEHAKTFHSLLTVEEKTDALIKEKDQLCQSLATERGEWAREKIILEDDKFALETYQKTLEQEKQTLSDTILEKNDELDQKDVEIYNSNTKIVELQNLLTTEKNNSKTIAQELEQKKTDWTTEKVNLIAEIEQQKRNCQKERDLKTEREKEITGLKEQIENAENNIKKLEQENQTLQTEKGTLETKLKNQKKEVVQELNNSLNLNLPPDSTLTEVIVYIEKLITKPPVIITDNSRIEELEKELSRIQPNNNPFGEDLVVIKEIDLQELKKILPQQLFVKAEKRSTNYTNYQQWALAKNEILKEYLDQNNQQLQTVSQAKTSLIDRQKNERLVWWVILVISLVGTATLASKLRKAKIANKNYRQSYHGIKEELQDLRKEMRILTSALLNRATSNQQN